MSTQLNIESCAPHYLRQWMIGERFLHAELNSHDTTRVFHALGNAAKFFGVARTLLRKYDVERGQKRYEPLLRAFQELPRASVFGDDFVDLVDQFQKRIGSLYGGKNLVSLSSKLLWLRYRDPFIIYDSRVRAALRASSADYREFAHRWLKRFEISQSQIIRVCRGLPSVNYPFAQTEDTREEVVTICSKPWFHRGVFDIYLWHEGG